MALNPSVSCELHNIGIADQRGELIFDQETPLSSTARFVASEGQNTTRVAVDTLDNILGERFAELVVKIDVEGFEEKVFLGADALFSNHLVKLVMFERLGRTNLERVRAFLEYRGYVVFRVTHKMSIATDERAISEPCINLFACPTDVFDTLRCVKE